MSENLARNGFYIPTGLAITKSQQNNLVTRNKEIVPVQSYWGTNVDGGKVESIEYCSRHTQDEEDGTEDTKDFSWCVHYEVKKGNATQLINQNQKINGTPWMNLRLCLIRRKLEATWNGCVGLLVFWRVI